MKRRFLAVAALLAVIFFYFSRRSTAYSIILAHDAPRSFRQESDLRLQRKVKESYQLRARNVRQLILKTHRFFQDHSIDYWVESGVLLGIHNYQDVIPYDADEDVGITRHGKNTLDRLFFSQENRNDNRVQFPEYGLRLKKNDNNILIYVLEDMETDVYCDIFYYNLKDGYLTQSNYSWVCKGCRGDFFKMPADNVFPLRTITAGDHETSFQITIPNRPRECLEYMYGSKLAPNYKWSEKYQEYIKA